MSVSVRPMAAEDLPFGMRLKEQAGWNQLDADWQRARDLEPDGCFVAEVDGVPAGTVTSCRFGEVAWIAMMLVDPAYRRRGVGRTLMVRALETLQRWGVRSVRLDATPLGRPLYESLGFQAETTFVRHQGILPPALERSGALPHVPVADVIEAVTALDRAVTGADRGALLRMLARQNPDSFRVARKHGKVVGFLLARPGAKARQIGPCIADDESGARLLEEVRTQYVGEAVMLDIPEGQARAAQVVTSWGFTRARELLRMGLGPRVVEDLERLWASAGAEKG